MGHVGASISELMDRPVPAGSCRGRAVNGPEWLLLRYLNRARNMRTTGYADTEDIDTAMRGACRLAVGPGELSAALGPDTVARWSSTFGAELGFPSTYSNQDVTRGGVAARPDTTDVVAPTSVGIVGTGIMGAGIAEAFARAGVTVRVASRTTSSTTRIGASLARALTRMRLDEAARESVARRIDIREGLAHLESCDLVIECVAEDLDAKSLVFTELDRLLPRTTTLATSTSSLRVREIAAATSTPSRVVGMHFFNPVPTMPLIELIATSHTTPHTIGVAESAARLVDKTVVWCGDSPGFIVNRLLIPYLNDALKVLRHTRTSSDLDASMCRLGFPMGPIALLELVGLDVGLSIQRTLHESFGDDDLTPDPLLMDLVEHSILGRKNHTSISEYLRSPASASDTSGAMARRP